MRHIRVFVKSCCVLMSIVSALALIPLAALRYQNPQDAFILDPIVKSFACLCFFSIIGSILLSGISKEKRS